MGECVAFGPVRIVLAIPVVSRGAAPVAKQRVIQVNAWPSSDTLHLSSPSVNVFRP